MKATKEIIFYRTTNNYNQNKPLLPFIGKRIIFYLFTSIYFQILSNGKYKSAEHRVLTTSTQSRVSIPVFTSPKPNEKIGPFPQVVERDGVARYHEVASDEYMKNYFANAHKGKNSLDFAMFYSS